MDSAFVLHVNTCLTPFERIHNASILFRDGLIQAVGGFSALRVLDDIPCVSLPDCDAIPGLIDTHIHGTGSFDAMAADVDANIDAVSLLLAAHGVTTFVPTLLAAARSRLLSVIDRLAAACSHDDYPGAVPVGIHLEGPYISSTRRGAQPPAHVRSIDLGEAAEFLAAGRGRVRIMTFAPELAHSQGLIRLLCEQGVAPSMGHTDAPADAVMAALSAGASRVTHLFNGMPALDRRQVGLTAVALTDDRVVIEIILDGTHVHPRMVDLACRAKPRSHVVAVSDSVMGTGIGDGTYRLGDDEVRIEGQVSKRVLDGTLAGACVPLLGAMDNLRRFSSLSESEAVACCTVNAARSVGLMDRGLIQPGKRGDVVVIDPQKQIAMTIIRGRVVHDPRGLVLTADGEPARDPVPAS